METRIIKIPSAGTIEILKSRAGGAQGRIPERVAAVGLVQGKLIEMVVAADIAEKAVDVTVVDIRGSCPQNMILLAIFGDTASVEAAIAQIEEAKTNNGI
jgi:ethanolamine utilization microcompartment shell protein EutS